jgi:hypothetical protein
MLEPARAQSSLDGCPETDVYGQCFDVMLACSTNGRSAFLYSINLNIRTFAAV